MIFKGNFLYTPALGELTVREGEYLVVEGEKCAGFYRVLPQEYAGQPVTDFGRALVLPAFSTGCGPTAPCAFPLLPPSTRRPPGG